jgi:large subunit ribosomal protein L35
MPKMKTNKAVAARVKVTGTGKMKRRKPGSGHLKSRKTPSQIRRFRKQCDLSPAFTKIARKKLGL